MDIYYYISILIAFWYFAVLFSAFSSRGNSKTRNESKKDVSVVVPFRNEEEKIASFLSDIQTWDNQVVKELILIDDGSLRVLTRDPS